jgi:S1-C subfamily serine protease
MDRMNPFRSGVMALLVLLSPGLMLRAQPEGRPDSQRGYLGVLLGPSEQGQTDIVVRDVMPDSPAAKAGLKKGDRVVKMGAEEVQDIERLVRAIAARKPGDQLKLGILRDGKEQTVSVTVGQRPAREAPALPRLPGRETPALPGLPGLRQPAFLGVQTQVLAPELKARLKAEADTGVVVTEVVPRSPAARAGLKRDDVQVVRGKEKLALKATLRERALGDFLTPGEDRVPRVDVESMVEQSRRIRELEKRIHKLEKK